jgi:hypothetical protein
VERHGTEEDKILGVGTGQEGGWNRAGERVEQQREWRGCTLHNTVLRIEEVHATVKGGYWIRKRIE